MSLSSANCVINGFGTMMGIAISLRSFLCAKRVATICSELDSACQEQLSKEDDDVCQDFVGDVLDRCIPY